nr:adenosylcobinamide-GDP ribazoletransferase [uncultured Actinoplanes sp.]
MEARAALVVERLAHEGGKEAALGWVTGLGALVAQTVPVPVAAVVAVVVTAAAIVAVPGRAWQGPAAVAASVLVVLALARHAVGRFGGITGDVLGAVTEAGTTVALVVLSLR